MENTLTEKQELTDMVMHITDGLCSAADTDEILEILASGVKVVTGAAAVCVARLEGDECIWEMEFSDVPKWKGMARPASVCAAGWSMQNKRELIGEEIECPGDRP